MSAGDDRASPNRGQRCTRAGQNEPFARSASLTGNRLAPIVRGMGRAASAWVLVALLGAGAGCGSADRGLEGPVSLAAAVAATAEAGSARTESVTVTDTDGHTWTTRSSGIHDYRSARSELTYEVEGHRSRLIIVGGTSYSELDGAEAFETAPGKRWIRNDPLTEERFEELNRDDCEHDPDAVDEQLRSCSSVMVFVDLSFDEEDPGETLEFLGEYGSPLSPIGREEVRGVPTVHVRMRVDFRRASEAWYREQGWSTRNIERALENQPTEPALVDVWVDNEGLVRRVRTTRSYEPAESEGFPELPEGWGSYTSVTTTEYFDFGADTAIQPPPDSEVIDADEWLRAATERARPLPLGPETP
jgi:hypothetical protein